MSMSPEIFTRFDSYLKGTVIRSRPLRRELESFTTNLRDSFGDRPELADLVLRISTTLDDMLSRQNSRTTPLHVRMVQGCIRVFMRPDRPKHEPDFEFDIAVLNATARTIRRPKLQIFLES